MTANELAIKSEVQKQSIVLEGSQGIYQLVEKTIGVPPDLVYKIGKGEGGYYASLYDLIAREMAMQFADPETVYEDDYRVKVRLRARYWNRAGKEIRDSEEYEIDCKLLYEKARFSWSQITGWKKVNGKNVPIREEGKKKVIRDDQHPENPPRVVVELPDKAEQELYENFLTLRRNKLAKAITCARRRLIQRAIGIKKFSFDPKDDNWTAEQKMSFYAFLPAEADKEAGIKAIHDLTDEELPEKEEKIEKPAEKEEKLAEEKKEEPAAEDTTAQKTEKENKQEEDENKDKQGKKKVSSKNVCAGCGAFVSKKVAEYSLAKYKKVLCYDCQKGQK